MASVKCRLAYYWQMLLCLGRSPKSGLVLCTCTACSSSDNGADGASQSPLRGEQTNQAEKLQRKSCRSVLKARVVTAAAYVFSTGHTSRPVAALVAACAGFPLCVARTHHSNEARLFGPLLGTRSRARFPAFGPVRLSNKIKGGGRKRPPPGHKAPAGRGFFEFHRGSR